MLKLLLLQKVVLEVLVENPGVRKKPAVLKDPGVRKDPGVKFRHF
jgi:hypothetical protein